ncbi:MAG: hypothetical protein WBB52_06530, partial [Acidimicrobiales bacterium]
SEAFDHCHELNTSPTINSPPTARRSGVRPRPFDLGWLGRMDGGGPATGELGGSVGNDGWLSSSQELFTVPSLITNTEWYTPAVTAGPKQVHPGSDAIYRPWDPFHLVRELRPAV